MSTNEEALRDLLGPAADLTPPASPDDRTEPGERTGGLIPGTGRRAEDHEPAPPQQGGGPGK